MVFLVILVAIALTGVILYNRLVSLKEAVVNSKTQIGIQLDRRGKVFDSLIASVKKFMDHEKGTLKEIVEARSELSKMDNFNTLDSKDRQKLEDSLSQKVQSGALESAINITMEAYPDLKSGSNMLQLQEEIVSTENKLSFAKQAFNDSIESFVAAKKSFPSNLLVKAFPDLDQEFDYWALSVEDIKEKETSRVSFD